MHIIGDVHGKINEYMRLVNGLQGDTLQLGDMGVGFADVELPKLDGHRFFRGNHDCPEDCQAHPNYLSDYGVDGDVFWMAGAYSIDKEWRVPGLSWWAGEELSLYHLQTASELFKENKPRIAITHDCPEDTMKQMFGVDYVIPNNTCLALSEMFSAHQPKLWLFGHHHRSVTMEINGTKFVCLNELETYELPDWGWA